MPPLAPMVPSSPPSEHFDHINREVILGDKMKAKDKVGLNFSFGLIISSENQVINCF
jgi:hypothetical protein